jgi:phthiocerol/phenolphthiocerol synthesis type-I polyketide synthase E
VTELNDAIAVIGMAGRFPGAADIDAFWDNLVAGRDTISRFTNDELTASGLEPALAGDPAYVPAKGVLEDADRFDAGLFGFSPREAEALDPQQRVFLECVWHALEDAGIDQHRTPHRIGLFAGASFSSYLLYNIMANPAMLASLGRAHILMSNDKDFLATRVSYKLGLTGPSMSVQTACSTSLTAVHLAVQSLLNGECDVAVAGGVSVSSPLREGYLFTPGGILSPDGTCRPFDGSAAGTVAGNGVGAVVLRRLDDAVTSGDRIDAVIRGTAVNNDGGDKVGYTAPSVNGQASVIAEALAVAGVNACEIGYVETHGTGTPLGDPIEIAALRKVFGDDPARTHDCFLGAVKGNVGHLDAAAGVVGLIKTVLVLRHAQIPATCYFDQANPALRLEDTPFTVPALTRSWPPGAAPRRAGVSSFGIGGTNVHAVLEEAPAPVRHPDISDREWLLPLSANTPAALADVATNLADVLALKPDLVLADVSGTLTTGRSELPYRTTVRARDLDEAVARLRSVSGAPVAAWASSRRPVFLYPGQGTQYAGMSRGLYDSEPGYRDVVDRCGAALSDGLGVELCDLLFADPQDEEAAARLTRTEFTQPALFVVEYALTCLWKSFGIVPGAMIGHSLGELVAATVAGVFDLDDALALVTERGRLVQRMPAGSMLAVLSAEYDVQRRLGDELSLAAVNGPQSCVVSGPDDAIERFRQRCADDGVLCRPLHTSHAFHSASMRQAADAFTETVRGVERHHPRIPFRSNVTGNWITAEQAVDPAYWGRQLREGVRFGDGMTALLEDPHNIFLEVGPGDVLRGFARQHTAWAPGHTALGSLRNSKDSVADRQLLLDSLGDLWSDGVPVDWAPTRRGVQRRVARLPGYPFARDRFWVEPGPAAAEPAPASGSARRPDVADWFATPGWRRVNTVETVDPVGTWVFLGGDNAVVDALVSRLDLDGRVVRVSRGSSFSRAADGAWILDPTSSDDYGKLWDSLDQNGVLVSRVVHLWLLRDQHNADSAGQNSEGQSEREHVRLFQRDGPGSLIALARSLDGRTDRDAALLIDILTQDAQQVLGTETIRGENAAVLGTALVVGQETTNVRCRTIDLTGSDRRDAALRALARVLADDSTPTELAVRGSHAWERTFDPVRRDGTGELLVRDGGVYLITGGLGGIGLAVASWLAGRSPSARLALTGRSALPPRPDWDDVLAKGGSGAEAVRTVRMIEAGGAQVLVLAADVTDEASMRAALEVIRSVHGPLNGVVHSAGLPSRGLMAGKTQQDIDEVMAAKSEGTLVLDGLCAGDPLDFFVLCSSTTAVLGGPGQSDYAAGNAFLGAHATRRRAEGVPMTAVLWDTWQDTGMTRGLTARLGGSPTGEPVDHPLITELIRGADGGDVFRSVLRTSEQWVLDEHRLLGNGLLPGTAYLELVRAIMDRAFPGRRIQFTDVYFLAPVIVPDQAAAELFTTIDVTSEQPSFTVRSRDHDRGWQVHASGTVRLLQEGDPPAPPLSAGPVPDFPVIETLSTEAGIKQRLRLDKVEEGEMLAFRFGPRWRSLRQIELGDGRLVVDLDLGDEFAGDLDRYRLHPALLDVAGAAARVYVEDVYYLPLTYRSLHVLRPLTQRVRCDVMIHPDSGNSGETMTCDMDILTVEGDVAVQVRGFTIKRINDVDTLVEQVRIQSAAAGQDESAHDGPTTVLGLLSEGMSPPQAQAALGLLLRAPLPPPEVVVSARDIRDLQELARTLTPSSLTDAAGQLTTTVAMHPRPSLRTIYVEPGDELEQTVAAVWSEVLGVEPVGLNDDFFALGGHSLAGIQIGAKIQKQLGIEFTIKEFFDRPTVGGTAEALRVRQRGEHAAAESIPRRPGDYLEDTDLADLTDEEVEAELAAFQREDQQ